MRVDMDPIVVQFAEPLRKVLQALLANFVSSGAQHQWSA